MTPDERKAWEAEGQAREDAITRLDGGIAPRRLGGIVWAKESLCLPSGGDVDAIETLARIDAIHARVSHGLPPESLDDVAFLLGLLGKPVVKRTRCQNCHGTGCQDCDWKGFTGL